MHQHISGQLSWLAGTPFAVLIPAQAGLVEDVGEMASSATYVFSKMTINIVELEDTIKQQKDEIWNIIRTTRALPNNITNMQILKEKLSDNLIIHLVDLTTKLKRLNSIRSKLPKPVEHQKVDGNE